jgi:isoleucyl-tRNA synthetase
MYGILEILVRAFAPILSFTADEIWQHMPARTAPSPLFATWQDIDVLSAAELDGKSQALIDDLFALRQAALKDIEVLRNEGKLGGSLEAAVRIEADAAARTVLAPYEAELRFFFITSEANLVDSAAPGPIALSSGRATVVVAPTAAPKCIRCWHLRADVGTHAEHPELCGRCVSNVDGPGETRKYF